MTVFFKDDEAIEDGFESSIKNIFREYVGKSTKTLLNDFGIENISKNSNNRLIALMFGKTSLLNIRELRMSNIQIKTIRIEGSGKVKESMSFPAFKFDKIIKRNWEKIIFEADVLYN